MNGCVARGRYGACWGGLQDHHLIPQRTIREHFKWWRSRTPAERERLGLPDELPVTLTAALADGRNKVRVCHQHHGWVEGHRFYLTRGDWPDGLEEFAAGLGLSWYLERTWPEAA